MAWRQQFKEDRAEAAAKLAAKDIGDINRANERDEGYTLNSELNFKQARAEAAAKLAAKDLEDVNRAKENMCREPRVDENKPGVIGSMFRAVQGTYEHAKEAVVGKPHETDQHSPGVYEKAKETKDAAGSKVGEYADATKQKAGEYADYASQKAKETTAYAGEKAKEAKDYTAEKAKEGKDSAAGKLGDLKDRAMGFFTGKKDVDARDKVMSGTEVDAAGPGGDRLVIKMEESRPGAVADALKAAGGVVGGGDVEEEGVIRVERRRHKM